jgi:rRNA maturation endonuclease Nob1
LREIILPEPPKRICPNCGSRNTDCGRIYDTHPWRFRGAQAICKDCGHKDEIRQHTEAWYDQAEYAAFKLKCEEALRQ